MGSKFLLVLSALILVSGQASAQLGVTPPAPGGSFSAPSLLPPGLDSGLRDAEQKSRSDEQKSQENGNIQKGPFEGEPAAAREIGA